MTETLKSPISTGNTMRTRTKQVRLDYLEDVEPSLACDLVRGMPFRVNPQG